MKNQQLQKPKNQVQTQNSFWQTKKLGEICDIEIGKTPPRSNKKFWDVEKQTGNVWLSIRDLSDAQDKIIFDSREYISNKGAEKSKKVKKGTLLVSFKLTLGRLAFAGKDLYTNEAIASLQIKKEKEICHEYLYRCLSYFDWNKATDGDIKVKGRTLNKAKLKEIKISFPHLPEQKRIVKILDEAFEKIEKAKENAEKNLKNSKELFESYLQNVFANPGKDWEEKKLGEVCNFMQGIQVDAHLQNETKKENQVRFLRIIDFTQGNELPRYIDNPGEKYIIGANDISLVRYGASTGFVCRGLDGVLANNLFRVIPKNIKQISNEYLFVFLKSPVFQKIIKKAMGGAAMPAISFGLIKDISIPIASLAEQKSIIKKLDTLSEQTKKLEEIYKKKLVDLEELKKSILNKAFKGEL